MEAWRQERLLQMPYFEGSFSFLLVSLSSVAGLTHWEINQTSRPIFMVAMVDSLKSRPKKHTGPFDLNYTVHDWLERTSFPVTVNILDNPFASQKSKLKRLPAR